MTDETLLVILARRPESKEEGVRFSTQFEAASRRAIAERVAKLQEPDTLRDANAWRTAALELVPGLPATFGTATRAIVIPHEVLWRVPFEALPLETGYLADATSIVYAPSVTALVRTPAVDPSAEPSNRDSLAARLRLVAVGAPELAPPVVEDLARTAPGWAIRNTTAAEQEVRAIANGRGSGSRAGPRWRRRDRSSPARAPPAG